MKSLKKINMLSSMKIRALCGGRCWNIYLLDENHQFTLNQKKKKKSLHLISNCSGFFFIDLYMENVLTELI